MRARWLKPEFFTDKKIATMTPMTALIYQALWCWADDGGVCICDPDWLKAQVFFRWESFTLDVLSKALRDLYDLKMILVYKVGDDYFAQIRHWTRHQNVHKPAKFRHPRPDEQLTLSSSLLPPGSPGESPGSNPASPPPRHLDSKTPRVLDAVVAAEPSRDDAGKSDDNIVDNTDSGGSIRFRELRLKLESDLDREALSAIASAVPEPASWIAEARASLDGMHGPPLSPRQLGEALREYVGNGNLRNPNFKHFRRYLENAGKTPGGVDSPRRDVESNGTRSPDPGEAGAILARLRSHGETDQPNHVRQAVRASGGLAAIQAVKPERFGFLLRDFAVALDFAIRNPEPMPEPKPFVPPPVVESDRMRAAREREEAWLAAHPGETLPTDFHFRKRGSTDA